MKEKCLLKSEDGSVLVLALVMLVLLTLLGIAASRTSSIEMLVSGNDMIYKQNLHMAEAGAMQGAQRLENIPNPKDNPPADNWLNPVVGDVTDAKIGVRAYWEEDVADGGAPYPPVTSLANTLFLAGSNGIVPGGSLDMSKSRVNSYTIYGRCARRNGVAIVKVGLRKAF